MRKGLATSSKSYRRASLDAARELARGASSTQVRSAHQRNETDVPVLPEPEEPRLQYAALPYRRGETLEILLISSRETGRWIVPKGWPMKRRAPHQAAAQEALEEAGVSGDIGARSLGAYHYRKRQPDGSAWLCRVEVFPLKVTTLKRNWPERAQRVRQWFDVQTAVEAVDEPELKAIIAGFKARGGVR